MILDPPKGNKKIILNKIFYFKPSSFLFPPLKAPILSFTILIYNTLKFNHW